jgi:hypothetical protein
MLPDELLRWAKSKGEILSSMESATTATLPTIVGMINTLKQKGAEP